MATDDLVIALLAYWIAVVGIIAIILFIAVLNTMWVVERGTTVVVERWGKFDRVLKPGFHVLVPFMDKAREIVWRSTETYYKAGTTRQEVRIFQIDVARIDLRESAMDFPNQYIITRDNVEIQVHPVLLFRLRDPIRVCYESYDLAQNVEKIVQTTLRAIVGDMGLDDTLASREEINKTLLSKIRNVCHNWGMEIIKVELLEIVPTPTIQDAMIKQLSAERMRRAAIIEADGFRQQRKTEAEGDMTSAIAVSRGEQLSSVLRAQASSEAKLIVAEAEAKAISIIADAVASFGGDPTQYLVALKYIDYFMHLSARAKNREIIMPVEAPLYGSLRRVIADEDDEKKKNQ